MRAMPRICIPIIAVAYVALCQSTEKYDYLGQEPPGAEPVRFAPGLITTELHDDSTPLFSPDGREMSFRFQGEPGPLVILMRLADGKWVGPEVDPLQAEFRLMRRCYSPDGQRIYCISRRPLSGEGEDKDADIWYVQREGTGWSGPVNLGAPVNTSANEYVWSIAADGTIYFMADREGGFGRLDIYRARLADGQYCEPENLGPPINTEHSESAPMIAPDQSFLVFSNLGRPDNLGDIDLYVSFRRSDGSWGEPVNLGERINAGEYNKFSALSPDGKYMFWVARRLQDGPSPRRTWNLGHFTGEPADYAGDVYWVELEGVLNSLKPED